MALHSEKDALPNTEDDNEHQAVFLGVMQSLRLDRLPNFALAVRRTQTAAENTTTFSECTVERPPAFGSYHVVYTVRFDDGVRWILKLPSNGHPEGFNEISSSSLESEALTMKMIARETAIPIPRVHHFEASSVQNQLGCAFIPMDFADGKHGPDCWFDKSVDATTLEARRTTMPRDVPAAMMQVGRFALDRGGALLFDGQGNPREIAHLRACDLFATLERAQEDDSDGSNVWVSIGPFDDTTGFTSSLLDRREAPPNDYSQGIYKILRCFIAWIDGSLAAIIDWDCVAPFPQCLANEVYPSWLTRDWDSVAYRDPKSEWENSIEELVRYRALYRMSIAEHRTGDPTDTSPAIAKKIFEKCCEAGPSLRDTERDMGVEDGSEDDEDDDRDDTIHMYDFVTELEEGEFDAVRLANVKAGLDALWVELEAADL